MDRYSLLKLKPALKSTLKLAPPSQQPDQKIIKESLYNILEESSSGVKGLKVRCFDGARRDVEYIVEKYERYKAGLMGRVWLKRSQSTSPQSSDSQSTARLVTDLEALGVKWKIV